MSLGGIKVDFSRSLLLAAMSLVVVLHLPALGGGFTSDSLALAANCSYPTTITDWWQWIAAQFAHGQGLGSHYYRPLVTLGFCADYAVFGLYAPGWHGVQLLLHLLNGVMVYRLMRLLLPITPELPWAAPLAALVFWLSPAAPEVSIWIAGRYDGLALLFSLLALESMLKLRVLASVIWLLLALASKESAMVTPALLGLSAWWAIDRRDAQLSALRKIGRALWLWTPCLLVFVAYLGLRWHIFGTPFSIYAAELKPSPISWLEKLPVLGQILLPTWRTQPLPYHGFWLLMALLMGLALVAAAALPVLRKTCLLSGTWLLLACGGLLPHIQVASSSGEGIRLLYASGAYFALTITPALALLLSSPSWRARMLAWTLTGLTLATLGAAQYPAQRDWSYAVHYVPRLQQSMRELADTVAATDWVLVLVPDHIGTALVARNGQGALVLPPYQPKPLLGQVAPFIAPGLPRWHQRIQIGEMHAIRGEVATGPFWPKRYYCADPVSARLIPVAISASSDPEIWQAQWQAALAGTTCAADLLQ